jgi:hypothetical protein
MAHAALGEAGPQSKLTAASPTISLRKVQYHFDLSSTVIAARYHSYRDLNRNKMDTPA